MARKSTFVCLPNMTAEECRRLQAYRPGRWTYACDGFTSGTTNQGFAWLTNLDSDDLSVVRQQLLYLTGGCGAAAPMRAQKKFQGLKKLPRTAPVFDDDDDTDAMAGEAGIGALGALHGGPEIAIGSSQCSMKDAVKLVHRALVTEADGSVLDARGRVVGRQSPLGSKDKDTLRVIAREIDALGVVSDVPCAPPSRSDRARAADNIMKQYNKLVQVTSALGHVGPM